MKKHGNARPDRRLPCFCFVCGTDGFIAPVVVDGYGVENGIVIDSNAVTSIHGRDNAVSKLLAEAISVEQSGRIGVYYIDKNKAAGLLQNAGLQLPGMLFRTDGYIHSIRDFASPVKPKIENVTKTRQFKRWFGDWQNHLNTASKVVIEDGAPKVVSRGKEKQRRRRYILRKKEATNLIGAGVHFPVRLQSMIASNPIIRSFDAKVNREISDVTQSQQFTRWLGDWQNCPGRASKVVNADGTPKVVYYGTDTDFNVFTSKDGICWFSESEDYPMTRLIRISGIPARENPMNR